MEMLNMYAKNKVFIILMLVSVLTLLTPVAMADTKTNMVTETFETDTANAHPTGFYTYAERNWLYSNVTDNLGRGTSTNSYSVNDTNGHANADAWFNITSFAYEELEFYVYQNSGYNNLTHIYVYFGTEYLLVNLSNSHINVGNSTNGALVNQTFYNSTWYRVR